MLTEMIRHPILAVRFIAKRIRQIPSLGVPRLRRSQSDDFDQKYGVETSRVVQIVPTDSPNFSHGTRYSPSAEPIIRWCIENCEMPYEETTFVDVGSGKGGVLILAAMYPFKKVIGVEYSAELAAVCRKNLAKLGIGSRCEVLIGDAAEFKFPGGKLLAFLYNPFDSVVLERVLKNLASTDGDVRIAHLGPGHDVIKRSGLARVLRSGEGPTLYEILSDRGPVNRSQTC